MLLLFCCVLAGSVFAWEAWSCARRARMVSRQHEAWCRGHRDGVILRRNGRGVPPPAGQTVSVPTFSRNRGEFVAFNRQMAYLDGRLFGWRDEDKRLYEYGQVCEVERGIRELEKWANRA